MDICRDKSLESYNSFGFPACAQYYIAIRTDAELLEALAYIEDNQLSYQLLCGGSNVLMQSDVTGVTLHIIPKGIECLHEDSEYVQLRIGAGENWHQLVAYSVKQQWQGLESLALIPGLAGAAPVQNIGAYGVELKDVLLHVHAYDTCEQRYIELDNQACLFAYRDSIFKQQPKRYIITAITIQLRKCAVAPVKYAALQQYIGINGDSYASLDQVFAAVCAVRQSKLPDPKVLGNAGSFFKNPCVAREHYQRLIAQFTDLVAYPLDDGNVKLAAGWLIDQCGWRGYQSQGVGVYPKQALVLTHSGGGSLEGLLALAEKIRETVRQKFAVELEIEPQLFG